MQIFVVEEQPQAIAKALCDKHVLSQIGETAELLALAHLRNGEKVPPITRLTPRWRHLNHPCAHWVGLTVANYRWTHQLNMALLFEYTYRYGKKHAYFDDVQRMMHPPFRLLGLDQPLTAHPAVMPKVYDPMSIIMSYRMYYHVKATRMPMRWTKRRTPKWFDAKIVFALRPSQHAYS